MLFTKSVAARESKLSAAVRVLVLISTTVLANCSAGSNWSTIVPLSVVTPNPTHSANPMSLGNLTVSVIVPKKVPSAASLARSTAMRQPEYVTSAVQSIVFTQTLSGNATLSSPTVTTMTIGGPNCTSSAGAQTCVAVLSAPLGQDQWTIDTYASLDGTGAPLSIGVLPFTILGGVANAASLTLNPIVSSLAFVPGSASCNASAVCTNAVILNAMDAQGATIIGATPFVNAAGTAMTISVASSPGLATETSLGAAASATFTNASADNIAKVAYNGLLSSPATLTVAASGGGLSAVYSLTLAAGTLTSSPGNVLSIGTNGTTTATLPVSEPGFTGSFTASPLNCAGVISVGALSSSGSPASFPLTQVGAGTCSVLLSDGQGGSTSVVITSTTFAVTIN